MKILWDSRWRKKYAVTTTNMSKMTFQGTVSRGQKDIINKYIKCHQYVMNCEEVVVMRSYSQ